MAEQSSRDREAAVEAMSDFADLVATNNDPTRVYGAIVQYGITKCGLSSCAVFVAAPGDEGVFKLHQVAFVGDEDIPPPPAWTAEARGFHGCSTCFQTDESSGCYYLDLIGPEEYLGTIAGRVADGDHNPSGELRQLGFYASIVGERVRLLRQGKHFVERYEVFREIAQLIASNADLERTARALVRQASLRFGSDCSLLLFMTKRGDELEIIGNHGITKDRAPKTIPLHNTLAGRALRHGSVLSIPDLNAQLEHDLNFISECGANSIRLAHLMSGGEPLGLLVIGYRRSQALASRGEALMQDFCQAASVAFTTARSQARLRAYADQLEELVKLRTADLEQQTHKAEESSRAKSRFVANMSHELRTPLTAIVGYASVIADGVFGPVNEKQKDALGSITRSSAHLKELIDEVLNLSRIEAGKEDPEPSRVELHSLLQQIYKLMLQTAVGKGVQLVPVKLDPEIKETKLWFDPRHIRQVLINLVSNAVKYTPEGGKVELIAEMVGDRIKIGVKDTGVGIPADKIETLFDRFERGDDSYSREQAGTGIGLALTKHLAEMNGARIYAESEVGRGSVFWAVVPCADQDGVAVDSSAAAHAADPVLSRLDGLNILICDDNELACRVLETAIQEAGGSAFLARTVAEAKKIADATDLDAAVVDLALPGESGLVLLDYLRRRSSSAYGRIPMIVVSACVFEKDRAAALEHGALYFVPKPFHPAELLRTIRAATTEAAMNSSASLQAVT
jgi:signal transduction histidine kinase/CheY-like chemotaxis protein